MNYRLLAPALRELTEAAEFYESRACGLGADFVREAEATIRRIMAFPEAWGEISKGFRRCSLRRFPHAIIYCPEGSPSAAKAGILIVSVFHHSRAPLSWRANLPPDSQA
jgi:plasmid stabilization system protein ParE